MASRDSFEFNECLTFMASSRIHYYKLADQEELFANENPSLMNWNNNYQSHHFENLRNIIMAMSSSFGGIILFGLGKQKLVEGIQLDS